MSGDVDLIAFITARLDEDEQSAQACDQQIWHAGSAWAADLLNPLPSQRRDHPGYIPMITQSDVNHIARHDPDRVLREVEAKRALVAMLVTAEPDLSFIGSGFHPGDDTELAAAALAHLALPYVDHPDYRQEWTP